MGLILDKTILRYCVFFFPSWFVSSLVGSDQAGPGQSVVGEEKGPSLKYSLELSFLTMFLSFFQIPVLGLKCLSPSCWKRHLLIRAWQMNNVRGAVLL